MVQKENNNSNLLYTDTTGDTSKNITYISSFEKFKTISDFKWCIKHGAEIEFEWENIVYSVTWNNGKVGITDVDNWDTNKDYDTIDELLSYRLVTGETLRDIITKAEIVSNNM